jgi:hypothetical protein
MQWSLAKYLLLSGLLLGASGAVAAQRFLDAAPARAAAGVADSPGTAGPLFQAVPPALAATAGRAHGFHFTRAMYGAGMGRWGRSWATDFPKADQQFLTVLRRLTSVDAFESENPVRLDDPALRRFPFLYAVEVGYMSLSDAEVKGLRDYLLAGGFLMVDDFWGTVEWNSFERQISRVLPEYPIVEIPMDHPIFSSLYEIPEIIQVPVVSQGIAGGPTHERDGYTAHCRGIFDEQGRLMVVINWNTDLGDAWEWADHPRYPLRFSSFAYQMGANFIVYAMSH